MCIFSEIISIPMNFRKTVLISLLLPAALCLLAGCNPKPYTLRGGSVTVKIQDPAPGGASVLRLQPAGPELIRVSASPDGRMHDRSSLVIVPQQQFSDFSVTEENGEVLVRTAALTAAVNPENGALRFLD